jgi:hypothetical protein
VIFQSVTDGRLLMVNLTTADISDSAGAQQIVGSSPLSAGAGLGLSTCSAMPPNRGSSLTQRAPIREDSDVLVVRLFCIGVEAVRSLPQEARFPLFQECCGALRLIDRVPNAALGLSLLLKRPPERDV